MSDSGGSRGRADRARARAQGRGRRSSCAPTSPSAGSPTGAVLRTGERAHWPSLTVLGTALAQGRLLVRFEEIADRTTAESARGTELQRRSWRRTSARGPRGVLRPPAARPARRAVDGGRRWARWPASMHLTAQDLLASVRRGARCCAVREPSWSRRSTWRWQDVVERPPRPARSGRRARGERVRLDVVTIFPDYLAPLDLSLLGRAGSAACSTCRCTTCATGPTTGTARSTTRRTAAAPAW